MPGPTNDVSCTTPSRSGMPGWALRTLSRYGGQCLVDGGQQLQGRRHVPGRDHARVGRDVGEQGGQVLEPDLMHARLLRDGVVARAWHAGRPARLS